MRYLNYLEGSYQKVTVTDMGRWEKFIICVTGQLAFANCDTDWDSSKSLNSLKTSQNAIGSKLTFKHNPILFEFILKTNF